MVVTPDRPTPDLCHSHTEQPKSSYKESQQLYGHMEKAHQIKKEHWNGFRDFGTPRRAGESKKQLERVGWWDILGQMQQQRDGCRGMCGGREPDTG